MEFFVSVTQQEKNQLAGKDDSNDQMHPSMFRDGFLGISYFADGMATDPLNCILAIEQSGGLLQTKALRFNNENVAE